uniref:CRISPR system Cms protein Csm4 n=1 Tax=candidate division WOR-3 bacterium TaxID=2052148 RepID=A0A7C6A820_UNCW3
MKFTLCKLKPKGPLHLGEREGWLEGSNTFIHSDTLFSGFCHAFQLLYKDLENHLKEFEINNPPFLISSAFPYWRDTLYFPTPKNQLPKEKDAKKVNFVDKNGFERLLRGEKLEEIIKEVKTIPQKEKPFVPWELDNIPRVGLGRLDSHPGDRFFHFGQVSYREDAGLFFLIRFLNDEFRPKFEATVRLLADEGIGGDRSSGKGLFEKPNFEVIEIDAPAEANGIISLSLYYPKDEKELVGIKSAFYDLIERKGYVFSPYGSSLRRRSIRMFTEGSVFPKEPEKMGKLVSVKPEAFKKHQVYRYGYIFTLPCKME